MTVVNFELGLRTQTGPRWVHRSSGGFTISPEGGNAQYVSSWIWRFTHDQHWIPRAYQRNDWSSQQHAHGNSRHSGDGHDFWFLQAVRRFVGMRHCLVFCHDSNVLYNITYFSFTNYISQQDVTLFALFLVFWLSSMWNFYVCCY